MARSADRTVTLVLDPDDDVEDLDPGPTRDPLWQLADLHLQAEHIHDLILLRAHTLSYPALRRLADHTQTAGVHLWLVVHQERAPAPIAQLLEGVPHDTMALPTLLAHAPNPVEPSDVDVPTGAGPRFPYLDALDFTFEPAPRRRVRTAITRELNRRDRARVYDTWDQAHAWTVAWLEQHADAPYPGAADAVYALARHGDTQSEIYVRIRAALDGFDLRRDPALPVQPRRQPRHRARRPQRRPRARRHLRDPHFIQQADLADLAHDGSVIAGPCGGTTAIPPELRRFLATWKNQLASTRPQPAVPLFPGDNADGRALLHRLTACNLWPYPTT